MAPRFQSEVLAAIRRHGPQRAGELTKSVGKSAEAVRHARDTLVKVGWLEHRDRQYRLGPATTVLSYAVARERVRCALVDGHGELLARQRSAEVVLPLPRCTAPPMTRERLLELLVELARTCMRDAGRVEPAAMALSWPGRVSAAEGAPASPKPYDVKPYDFDERRLLQDAAQELGLAKLPRVVVNDADAETLAETWWGVASDAEVVLGIKLAGGIGSSLVVRRAIHLGSQGSVGEIGHLDVALDRCNDQRRDVVKLADVPSCSCGTDAPHLERFASGRAMVERLLLTDEDTAADLSAGYESAVHGLDVQNGRVQLVMLHAGKLVGQALAAPVLLLEPDVVVVSAFPRGNAVADAARSELAERLSQEVAVTLSTPREEQGSWMAVKGAAAHALDVCVFPCAPTPK